MPSDSAAAQASTTLLCLPSYTARRARIVVKTTAPHDTGIIKLSGTHRDLQPTRRARPCPQQRPRWRRACQPIKNTVCQSHTHTQGVVETPGGIGNQLLASNSCSHTRGALANHSFRSKKGYSQTGHHPVATCTLVHHQLTHTQCQYQGEPYITLTRWNQHIMSGACQDYDQHTS